MEPTQVLVDTGAGVSVVTENFLQTIKHSRREVKDRKFFAANGKPIGNDLFATFDLEVPALKGKGYKGRKFIRIIDALILNDRNVPFSNILLGESELTRLEIDICYSTKEIKFTQFKASLPMIKRVNKFNIATINKIMNDYTIPEDLLKDRQLGQSIGNQAVSNNHVHTRQNSTFTKNNPKAEHNHKKSLDNPQKQKWIDSNFDNCSISNMSVRASPGSSIPKTADSLKKNPNSRAEYKIKIERIRAKRLEEYTLCDISFDEDFCAKNGNIKKKCIDIFEEFKDVFQNVTGVTHSNFAVDADIGGEYSNARQTSVNRTPAVEKAIIEKLDLEVSDGVLVFPDEHDVIPANYLTIMPIEKKDEHGIVIPIVDGGDMRMIGDCRKRLNKITNFAAMEIDSLADTLQKAAKASVHKYKMKFDISNAFHQIPMNKKLWKFFCIYHPIQGTMCYTRLCQGWSGSFGWTRNIFLHIFSKFHDCLYRYMDDGFLYGTSEEQFLELLRLFLSTCRYYGLKLKGKKIKLFEQEMNFLGTVIKNGKIGPNPHHVIKTKKITIEDVKTASDLKKFLGMCVSLARHLRRSTDIFKHLRKEAGKEGKTIILWKENNGFLEKEFGKAKRALDELTILTPFDREKPAYILVDTSLDGTGAILYQKDESNENNVIEFFSRKRLDAERKYVASSCILECAGMCGAVNFWRRYLEDAKYPTTVFTDSRSLEAVATRFANNKIPSDVRLINKFFSDLQGLTLRVKYIPGKSIQIQGVDSMSRSLGASECGTSCEICKLASIPSNIPTAFINNISELCSQLKTKYNFHKDQSFTEAILPSKENFQKFEQNDNSNILWIDTPTANQTSTLQNDRPRNDSTFEYENHYAMLPLKQDTEAFDVKYLTAPINTGPESKFSLNELLTCHWYLRDAQAKIKHIKQAKRYIATNEKVPPRHSRVESLIHKKKAFLEHGILKYKRWLGEDQFTVIPIPVSIINEAIAAVHREYGCKSVTQMCNLFNPHFECENSKTFIDNYLKRCTKCILLRRNATRKQHITKKIPIPEKIGEQIYVDEIHRTDRKGNNIRIYFATEGLSRFAISSVIPETATSENFIKFMCTARAILAPLHNTEVKVILRCDAAAPHTAKDTQAKLRRFGIHLDIYQSSSISKNIIPEHDARIATFGKYLNVSLNNPGMHVDQAILWATVQYNHSLTNLNWSPAELFTSRRLGCQTNLNLKNEELIHRINECRLKARQASDREKQRKKKKKLLKFKPWNDTYLNAPEVLEKLREEYELIKTGDIVKLHINYEKNDLNRLYVIKDINWDKNTFEAQKLNTPKGKIFTFTLSAIDVVQSDYIRAVGEQNRKRLRLLAHFALEDHGYDLCEKDNMNDLTNKVDISCDSGVGTPGPLTPFTPGPLTPLNDTGDYTTLNKLDTINESSENITTTHNLSASSEELDFNDFNLTSTPNPNATLQLDTSKEISSDDSISPLQESDLQNLSKIDDTVISGENNFNNSTDVTIANSPNSSKQAEQQPSINRRQSQRQSKPSGFYESMYKMYYGPK